MDNTIVSFIRIRLLVISLAALGFGGPAVADTAVVPDTAGDKTLLVVGDSLSAGYGLELADTWVAMLEDRLQEEGYGYRVVNASISGDTTSNGRRRLPRALNIHQPDIVIIELGGNDGLRGLPIPVMQQNLEDMILMTKERGALPVIAGIQIPPSYGEDYASEFAAVYPTLAEKYATPLIPFFMKNVALDPSMMQEDGIHPNKKAQPFLAENVWNILKNALAELASGAIAKPSAVSVQ